MLARTSSPKPPVAQPQRVAWAWVAAAVLLCLLFQALLVPAQRINERTHFHLTGSSSYSSISINSSAGLAPTPSQSVAQAVFAHREDHHQDAHQGAQPHQHGGLQNHDHGLRADVVYISDQASAAASRHTAVAKRLLLDQDGLWAALLPALLIQVARVDHLKSTLLISTRNELPLERPPRG